MKLRHPGFIRLAGFVAAWVIRLWMRTLCVRVHVEDNRPHPEDPRRQRCIYAFWHETILSVMAFYAKTHFLVSDHADGELIAQVCRHYRTGTVRGSTTRQGGRALRAMMNVNLRGHLGVTPDGPCGPRRQVQRGLIFLASHTGLPIIPFGMGYGRAWRLSSWDRFALPCPWSGVDCVVGSPIQVPPRLSREDLEHYRQVVEREMLRLTAAAESRASRRGGRKVDKRMASALNSERPAA